MSFWYTEFLVERDNGNIDWVNDDFEVLIVMANSTAGTDRNAATIDAIGTLDECDGSGYARQALTNVSVTKDSVNYRSKVDADDPVFASLGAGTRQNVGAVVYKKVNDDSDSIPAAYVDDGGFPSDGDGGNFTLQWHADGIGRSMNA